MKALVFDGVEKIAYATVPDPQISDSRDAIVKVGLTAICGSDLHVYHGRECGLDCGTVMGHEFMGTVAAVGSEVKGLTVGDRVVSAFTTSCGFCFFCREGLTCRCVHSQLYGWVEKGEGLHGAQAEYVRVPHADHTLIKPDPLLNDEVSLMLGDIMATGYHVARMADIRPGGSCAVVGCGPVGMMAVAGAVELGLEQIYVIDRIPERLEIGRNFGAVPINFEEVDPRQVIGEATEGRGVDGVLEVVGSPAASALAYDLVRPGGVISIAGVHTEPHFSISPAQAYDKNLTIRIGRCPARSYMEPLQKMALKGRYDLSSIVSHRLDLARGVGAYDMFAKRRDNCTKVMLRP